ncbi:MAG: efflux RND transporter periplasmic adaptor subunit [Candidatus Cryptobacteroides sp.]
MKRMAAALSLILCLAVSCRERETRYERKPVGVKVVEVKSRENIRTSQYVGEVEAGTSIPVSPLVSGQIVELKVRNGETVSKGKVLLKLDDTQMRGALTSAEAAYRQARDGYARVKKIYDRGGTTEVQMVEMETKLNQAKAMKVIAEKNLANCTLTAPCAGIVSGLEVHTGQNLLPGVKICEIVNMASLNIATNIPESEVSSVAVGDEATVSFPVLGEMELSAVVTEKSLTANRIGHSYRVQLSLRDTQDAGLVPGMVGKVYLHSGTESGVVVPAGCISEFAGEPTVWVIEGRRAVRRKVETGKYADGGVIITSGLRDGEKVVVSGGYKLYDGAETITLE